MANEWMNSAVQTICYREHQGHELRGPDDVGLDEGLVEVRGDGQVGDAHAVRAAAHLEGDFQHILLRCV